MGWPHILAGRSTLISAPTGSGKTLAAFLACIDRLVGQAVGGTLADRTEVLYVSPLKALGNDIQKNLDGPLAEILRARRANAVSTSQRFARPSARATRSCPLAGRCCDQPPHILVTTPESLYILLTAEKSRAILETVRTVIVDEIHAVADDKRGAHLALSLERLDALVEPARDAHRSVGHAEADRDWWRSSSPAPAVPIPSSSRSIRGARSTWRSRCRPASWVRSRRTSSGAKSTIGSRRSCASIDRRSCS